MNIQFYPNNTGINGTGGPLLGLANGSLINGSREDAGGIFAGTSLGVGAEPDPLAQKKEAAQKQAMKLLSDAFDGEAKIDGTMDRQRAQFRELSEQRGELLRELRAMGEDSAETESDLTADSTFGRSGAEQGTESGISADREKTPREELSDLLADTEAEMKGIDQSLRSAKIERAKHDNMKDAYDEAETVLAAAREDIIGSLRGEVMAHIDEEAEEAKEKAEEIKEEKEALAERIERHREEKQDAGELTADILEAVHDGPADAGSVEDAQEQVSRLLTKLGLLEDDIKGAAVDERK